MSATTTPVQGKQLLHLVFGGELVDLDSVDFTDLSKLDIVGIFPNYASAHAAWKAKAQATIVRVNSFFIFFVCFICRVGFPTSGADAAGGKKVTLL